MPHNRKVVVITGASAGVGRATARKFGKEGWDIGLIARGKDRLEAARSEVERAGGRALVLPADVADAAAVEAAADRVERELGPIDVWINNAMATVFAPVSRLRAEEVRRVTEVTYLGFVHGTMAALRHMRGRNHGTIVQIGSALAYRSIPLQSAYCAAKAAIRGFTDSIRCELIHERSRVRITMVQLPAVNTPQFEWALNRMPRRAQPVPPIHQPEPIARAIFNAAQTAPRELWVGSPSIQAILGTMVMPGVLDRMMARDAWDGQMTDSPADAGRPNNLFDPPGGDFGAHGRFDSRANAEVMAVSEEFVRSALVGAAVGLGAAAVLAGRFLRLRQSD